MKNLLWLGVLICGTAAIGADSFSADVKGQSRMELKIIPRPYFTDLRKGSFKLTPETPVLYSGDNRVADMARYLADFIFSDQTSSSSIQPAVNTPTPVAAIYLSLEKIKSAVNEAYELEVNPQGIHLRAQTTAGLFHAIQTLRQLLPAELEGKKPGGYAEIPSLLIQDQPRFRWRGMLLDCGRHFMTPDFIKRYIDLLALYKMNVLHWHLTEDQGWRIEIKRYPRLTEIGAWRTYEDGTVYGGFYTQEEIRDIVAHAASRHVQVVPEIEMPGHSLAALSAYPEYSCTGGPFAVETQWGVFPDIYCAGNDSSFIFLENVLSEVMDLFPSPYIHIGGDEAPKMRWQACRRCQERMRLENLPDENALQSYFIRRMAEFLRRNNRRLIGWDEILEGGLAPEATVQSWRGMEGAIAAARQGHDAIVSPTSHAYFDAPAQSIDLRRVFSFEPVPKELDEAERSHILGGECNIWTERSPQSQVDSKVFPRLLAMAERLWTPAQNRDFENFLARVRHHYDRLQRLGVTYGPEAQPVTIVPVFDAGRKVYRIELLTGEKDLQVYYTLDGSEPDARSSPYIKPFTISQSLTLTARGYRAGSPYGSVVQKLFELHGAVGKRLRVKYSASKKYLAGGSDALIDGMNGSSVFRDGYWQGYEQDDLDAVIDLGKIKPIQAIEASFLQDANSWIFLPRRVRFEISEDDRTFSPVAELTHDVPQKTQDAVIRNFREVLLATRARYVRVFAENVGVCPDWHPGAGGKAWIFADEIRVE